MPGAAGPVSMMLMEHQFGRWHVSRMAEAAKSYADGKREAGAEWADAALDRATLPREHIAKENSVLVRYVASRLTCIKSALKAVCLACMMRKVFWRWADQWARVRDRRVPVAHRRVRAHLRAAGVLLLPAHLQSLPESLSASVQ